MTPFEALADPTRRREIVDRAGIHQSGVSRHLRILHEAGFVSVRWGPEGFRVEVHTLEARVGGSLEYDMIADAPDAIASMKRMGQPLSHLQPLSVDEEAPLTDDSVTR